MDIHRLFTNHAPSIWSPLRFFLTAPLFGILAGLFIFFSDPLVLIDRYSIDAIVATHLLTIGFFLFVMFGSLTQLLPLLTGLNIVKGRVVALLSYLFLVSGLLCMAIGLKCEISILTTFSYLLLGCGFFIMLSAVIFTLRNLVNYTATMRGIVVSLVFSLFIALFGIFLLFEYSVNDFSEYHNIVANIHSVWAIFGFSGVLIIGVSFQILPMFYIAPKFKQFCKRRVVYLITIGLLLWLLASTFFQEYALYAKLWITLFFLAFATAVWIKFNKRKKPKKDVTVWYWRSASLFLMLGSFLWIFDEFFKHEYIVMVAILIGGGFILSIMLGMLYKIVPFLVWFHLDAEGFKDIKTTEQMIDVDLAKIQYILLILSIIGFIYAFYMPKLLMPSASFFVLSMLILEFNLLTPVFVYVKMMKSVSYDTPLLDSVEGEEK